MITEIEDYFILGCGRCDRFAAPDCSTRFWAGGLAAVRRICRDMGLVETVKWGHPCYMHAGRNIAIMGAFRGDYRLTLFNAALLSDPDALLQKQGPNTRHPDAVRLTDNDAVARLEPAIRALLRQAMDHAQAGRLPPKDPAQIELPDELVEALDADADLAEAFHALTPGRQRSYAINLNGTNVPATRIARIEKFRPKILAGKGATDR